MWNYNQSLGWLDKDGVLVSKDCYSGNGEGFNNPAMENVEGIGPIPCGFWKIVGPPYKDPKLGPYVLKLAPVSQSFRQDIIAMGRDPDSFRMHGKPKPPADIKSGSKGCICADEPDRSRVYQSGDDDLFVYSGIQGQPTSPADIS